MSAGCTHSQTTVRSSHGKTRWNALTGGFSITSHAYPNAITGRTAAVSLLRSARAYGRSAQTVRPRAKSHRARMPGAAIQRSWLPEIHRSGATQRARAAEPSVAIHAVRRLAKVRMYAPYAPRAQSQS